MKNHILTVLTVLIAFHSHAQTTLEHNGHTIVISKATTALVSDPFTNTYRDVEVPGEPQKLDGRPIYRAQDLTKSPTLKDSMGNDVKLSMFIFLATRQSFEELNNGRYVPDITDIIVDSTGRLVYWNFTGVKSFARFEGSGGYDPLPLVTGLIPKRLEKKLNKRVKKSLEQLPLSTPPHIGKQPVAVTGYLFSKGNYIEVKNHKATLHEDYWSL